MSASRAVIVCLDTLGDLTLRQPLFAALLDAGYEVRLALRPAYASFVPFLDPRLTILPAEVDPYQASDRTRPQLEALRDAIQAGQPDLVVFPAYTRSFAEEWLLRRTSVPRTAAFSAPLPQAARTTLASLLPEGEVDAPARPAIAVDAAEEDHEGAKNAALAAAILGRALPDREPTLTLPDGVRAEAAALLGARGLEPGRYVFGCPAGTANNPLKGWPVATYSELVVHLHRRHRLPVLLSGLPQEAAHLAAVARASQAIDAAVEVQVVEDAALPLLLGLIAHSRLYVGTDTGPMHFAGALGVPVVAAFGGGHWPRFLPRARRSFVATQELPCFGCGWACWLSEAACVTAIDAEAVRGGIDWILGTGPDERRIDRGHPLEPVADRVIRSALGIRRSHERAWRAALERLERDAAARLEAMERAGRQLQELEAVHRSDVEALSAHIRRLQDDCDERLRHMEKLGAIIKDLQGAIEGQQRLIDGQQAVLSRGTVRLLRRLRLA